MSNAMVWCLLIVSVFCASNTAPGAEDGEKADAETVLARAIEHTWQDIEEVKSRLLVRRKETSTERVALSRQVAELTAEVKEKRELWQRLSQAEEGHADLRALRDTLDFLEEQLTLTRSILVEARRSAEVQLDLVDALAYASELAEMDELLKAIEEDTDAIPSVAARLLEFTARHLEEAGRIRRTPGHAVGADGREFEGTFIQIGGVLALFAGKGEAAPSGIVRVQHGSRRPHVWAAATSEVEAAIARVAAGAGGEVPIDVTSGAALRAKEARRTLSDEIRAGGVVMVPIIAIAVVCFAVGIWKLIQLLKIRRNFDQPLVKVLNLIRVGRIEEAAAFARRASPPLRRLMEEGVAHWDTSREALEEMMHEAIIVEVPPLERHLAILAVGAAVSPLLGLLGTVTGMIHTFSLIAVFGTGDPRLLSGGISEALVTTEAGLAVAIPLVLLHAFLSRRVRAITEGLEKSAVSFINTLKTRNQTLVSEAQRQDDRR